MDFDRWEAMWSRTAESIMAQEGRVKALVIAPPASDAEVRAVEDQLGMQLPPELRTTLTTFSSKVHFAWRMPLASALPPPVRRVIHGEVSWDLSQLVAHEESRQGWAELYDSPDTAAVWADKLAFQCAGNGDLLAIDLQAPGHPVIYLDHDGESLHGRVLAPGFVEFISRWSSIGCVGPEAWELKPFLDEHGIDAGGAGAQVWQEWLDASLRGRHAPRGTQLP